MYFIRSTTIIIVILFTIKCLQGKSLHSSTIPNKIRDHIKYLLYLNPVENEYARFLSYLKVHAPKDNMRLNKLYHEYFSFNTYISDLVDAYAKYFTIEEIMELVKFYSTPLGAKLIRFNHQINLQMEDLMLTKISDYIFTSAEYGFTIDLPEFH